MMKKLFIYNKTVLVCIETNVEVGLPYWEARQKQNPDIRIVIKEGGVLP